MKIPQLKFDFIIFYFYFFMGLLTKIFNDVKWGAQQRIWCVYFDHVTIWRQTVRACIKVLFLCCMCITRILKSFWQNIL